MDKCLNGVERVNKKLVGSMMKQSIRIYLMKYK